jgi:hypothetical protein
MYGGGSGIATCGSQQVRLITRRMRLTLRGASARRTALRGCTFTVFTGFACLTYWLCLAGVSAT